MYTKLKKVKQVEIAGDYKKQNSKLISSTGTTLIISKREHHTPSKPKYFLLYLDPISRNRQYLSSLYWHEDYFSFEYNRRKYTLKRHGEIMVIE